jgi:hypothetical protein
MWAVVRTLVGICLVLFIVAIVVSPYVELPLTTAGAQQVTLSVFAALVMAAVVATVLPHVLRNRIRTWEQCLAISVHGRGRLNLTCALLC